jgi:hypothetical protein
MVTGVTFPEPGATVPYIVLERFSTSGVPRIRRGGGLTAMVVFFGAREAVGNSDTFRVKFPWIILLVTCGPEELLTRVSARTTAGSKRRVAQITAMSSLNPEEVLRS